MTPSPYSFTLFPNSFNPIPTHPPFHSLPLLIHPFLQLFHSLFPVSSPLSPSFFILPPSSFTLFLQLIHPFPPTFSPPFPNVFTTPLRLIHLFPNSSNLPPPPANSPFQHIHPLPSTSLLFSHLLAQS